MVIVRVAVASAAPGSAASAGGFADIAGGAQAQYELSGWHELETREGQPTAAPEDLVLAGFRVHGFAGGKRIGFHVGLAMAAGGTARGGGFAYDVSLFPFGVGVRLGDTSFISLGAGIGANGAIGTLDDAVTFPLEARFEFGRAYRLLGRARASYLGGAAGRKDGGMSTSLADELEAMLAIRLGHAYNEWGFPSGNGYFIGGTARESLGARYIGLVIGYSVDMATRQSEPIGL